MINNNPKKNKSKMGSLISSTKIEVKQKKKVMLVKMKNIINIKIFCIIK